MKLLTILLLFLSPAFAHPANYCYSCARDSHGRIKRSTAAKQEFKDRHPCPSTGKSTGPCPGYVVDHSKPLACGGTDTASNMGWQDTVSAKNKDRWERKGCK